MTSILTNIAAMSALQTLRGIGSDMEATQGRVSSGMRVGTASDNAAYWSIATTMRSDNMALSAVQDALGLGAAKVDTAYAAMESVVDVVEEIKAKLVAAREAGVDKAKIQEEITQLQGQLKNISESASFSGENWLQIEMEVDADGNVVDTKKQVVASFTRDSSGNVAVKTIDIALNGNNVLFDLAGNKNGLLDAEALALGQIAVKITEDASTSSPAVTVTYYATSLTDADIKNLADVTTDTNAADDLYSNGTSTYYKVAEDTWVKVTATDPMAPTGTTTAITAGFYLDTSGTNASTTATFVDTLSVYTLDITKLSSLDIGDADADDADKLDFMIQYVDKRLEALISSTAALGSVSMRIEMQENFASRLTDSIDSGIGRLVDADMNEESTKLKALQTQQQLAIQSLSIANTNSENILSLFRQ